MIEFTQYHKDNPHIWDAFKKVSIEARSKGFDRFSANGIFEIIRWNTTLETRDKYKVNNNYRQAQRNKWTIASQFSWNVLKCNFNGLNGSKSASSFFVVHLPC